jgi:hypothetical protein
MVLLYVKHYLANPPLPQAEIQVVVAGDNPKIAAVKVAIWDALAAEGHDFLIGNMGIIFAGRMLRDDNKPIRHYVGEGGIDLNLVLREGGWDYVEPEEEVAGCNRRPKSKRRKSKRKKSGRKRSGRKKSGRKKSGRKRSGRKKSGRRR